MEPTLQDNNEIDLMELFFVLLERWKWILLSTVLVGVIAFFYTKLVVTPMYRSSSQLYIFSKGNQTTILTDLQTGTNLTKDFMVVVKGRTVVETVIQNLQLNVSYENLSKRISLDNPQNTRILDITVVDTIPDRAKAIADEMAVVSSAYIAEKMNLDPPNITEKGNLSARPVSPNVRQNTGIGALAGLFIAVAIILVIHLLNDTIQTAEDVEKKLGLNVLAALPETKSVYQKKSKGKWTSSKSHMHSKR